MQLANIWHNTNEAQQVPITVVLDVLLINVPLTNTAWSQFWDLTELIFSSVCELQQVTNIFTVNQNMKQ